MATLKVLHIASSLSGGAGLACLRLHEALLNEGIDSTVLTLIPIKGYPKVQRVFPKKKSFVYRVLRRLKLAFLYDKFLLTDVYIEKKLTKKKYEAYALSRQGSDFKEYLSTNKFDIVNLHWVASQVDLESMLNCIKESKIVWTLHDMNPFTAGCTASMGCELFKTIGCEKCPQLINSHYDIAKANFERKKRILSNANITMISSSSQLYENAKQSLITQTLEHKLIPLANFSYIYIKSKIEHLKHDFGLSLTKTIIGFGAVGINRPNKGLDILLNTLKELPTQNFQLVIFGQGNLDQFDLANIDVKYYGNVSDKNQLAMLYKTMDAFISISQQEAFGQTFMEALCQGTPIIGTHTGAIPDFVTDKNGVVLKERNSKTLKSSIENFDNTSYDRDNIALKAKEDFSPEVMISKYLQLYKSLVRK